MWDRNAEGVDKCDKSEVPLQLWHLFIDLFIHSFCSLSYDSPQSFPKRFLHRMTPSASSVDLQYPVVSLMPSSSCLRILPRRPVTYIPPSIFPSIICFGRQFLHMWPILLAFFLSNVCMIFLCSLTLCNNFLISHTIGPTDLLHPSPVSHFKTFQAFLIYFPKCPSFSTTQCYALSVALH